MEKVFIVKKTRRKKYKPTLKYETHIENQLSVTLLCN
jgi:hypothetical protein